MKALLKFNLPEEQYDFDTAINGNKYKSSLWDFDQWLRSKIKHEDLKQEEYDLFQEVRDKLHETMEDCGVNLYDEP